MYIYAQRFQRKWRQVQQYVLTLRSLFQLLWRISPAFFCLWLLLTLLTGLLPLVLITLTSALLQVLAQATTVLPTQHAPISSTFFLLLLLFAGANLVAQMLQNVNAVIQELYRARCSNHVQLLLLSKAAEIDLAYFEHPEFHNQMRTAANEAPFRIPMFIDQLMGTITTLTTFVSLSLVLILWQIWIVPVICLASLVLFAVSLHFGSRQVQLIEQRGELEHKKFYFTTLLTSEQAAKEIRLFGLRDFLLQKVRTLLETTYRQDSQLAWRRMWGAGAADLVLTATQLLVLAFTALQTALGYISLGQFNLYMQSILQLVSLLKTLATFQGGMHGSNLFAANLFQFLALSPQVEARRSVSLSPQPVPVRAPRIEFRDVSFRYPGTEQPVLHQVSFTIAPGEAVALVGENGAGKTTLVKLLSGLYEPTEGQILLDNQDIRTLDRTALRAYLSVIFQDYTIYHLSAYENIGVGQVQFIEEVTRLEEAARRSGLERVVQALPEGYETILGRFWEHGHELSGGQQQLVALSRALLRDAPVLLLDEPSAALDIYTERRFFQQLLEERQGLASDARTVIFISHRFATVRRADRILVLEHGRVLEQGTHDALIAQGGRYADMFLLQAEPYGPTDQAIKHG
ncbi:HlyB/MsbA family ABC transporter [Dictyobacter sp. S3.2.2.5]|uniref:HlyB/MsbA family ABC transporter n=1 Tax=Dictyobacter halimunensis TaxID=3026934 RepID=A0ABQ6FMF6_9CHLR|nr:HlyB/MsbA family ABC transporter [Dictyobacter sp. S3.2.2.5]